MSFSLYAKALNFKFRFGTDSPELIADRLATIASDIRSGAIIVHRLVESKAQVVDDFMEFKVELVFAQAESETPNSPETPLAP